MEIRQKPSDLGVAIGRLPVRSVSLFLFLANSNINLGGGGVSQLSIYLSIPIASICDQSKK